jgi:hypothetical protein
MPTSIYVREFESVLVRVRECLCELAWMRWEHAANLWRAQSLTHPFNIDGGIYLYITMFLCLCELAWMRWEHAANLCRAQSLTHPFSIDGGIYLYITMFLCSWIKSCTFSSYPIHRFLFFVWHIVSPYWQSRCHRAVTLQDRCTFRCHASLCSRTQLWNPCVVGFHNGGFTTPVGCHWNIIIESSERSCYVYDEFCFHGLHIFCRYDTHEPACEPEEMGLR